MRPRTESLGYIDISNGTSETFNKFIDAVGYDMTDAYNVVNEVEDYVEKSSNAIVQENMFLNRKIKELESKLNDLKGTLSERTSLSRFNYMSKSFYSATDIEDAGNSKIESNYGIVTIDYDQNEKVPISKYNKEFLKSNIDIIVNIRDSAGLSEIIDIANDNSLINILDREESTVWSKTIDRGTGINYIDFDVIINLPVKLLSNLSLNSIGIRPHPLYSLKIMNLSYLSPAQNEYVTIPEFEEIAGIGDTKLIFNTIATTSIKVTFRQSYYLQYGSNRRFIIGLRGIDLDSIIPKRESTTFVTKFAIPRQVKLFRLISTPEYVTQSNIDYGDTLSSELYYDLRASPINFDENISINTSVVYIKTTLTKVGDVIPVVRGIKIKYLTK